MPAAQPTLATHLTAGLTVGDPDVTGPLAVFPLFGGDPRLEYLSFAEAASRGARVTELPGAASVNDLLVVNPLDLAVLLYEGEELLGAQQNRTIDAAVLVPAGAELRVPVTCVEQGRWQDARHGEAFEASDQAAFPELRRHKSRRMRERLSDGLEARADQGEVWHEIEHKSARLAASSPTGAMSDIYDQRRDRLRDLQGAITRRDGQLGSVAAIGGAFAVLDYVSRPDVFAALHGPLVQGYALDAVEHEAVPPPTRAEAQAFVAAVLERVPRRAPSAGLGHVLHFDGRLVGGTGLSCDGELVQLSAFAEDASRRRSVRIRRPSQRG